METTNINEPQYWNLLSNADKNIYEEIRKAISQPIIGSKRNKKIQEFRDTLQAIEIFENRETTDKWKRCLVCGIYFFENGIAVNTNQFKKLILKCKSSINGSLNEIGYSKILNKTEAFSKLIQEIPSLNNNYSELRSWTIRLFEKPTPIGSTYTEQAMKEETNSPSSLSSPTQDESSYQCQTNSPSSLSSPTQDESSYQCQTIASSDSFICSEKEMWNEFDNADLLFDDMGDLFVF